MMLRVHASNRSSGFAFNLPESGSGQGHHHVLGSLGSLRARPQERRHEGYLTCRRPVAQTPLLLPYYYPCLLHTVTVTSPQRLS